MKMAPDFATPRQGMHAWRLPGDLAGVDVLGTVVIVFILSRLLHGSFWTYLAVAVLLGILAHRLFNVRTTVDKLLFP